MVEIWKNVIHFSRALNTVDMIVKKLGHLIEGYLPSLESILLGLTATCVACLERREEITPGALKPLKNLRQLCIAQIQQVSQREREWERLRERWREIYFDTTMFKKRLLFYGVFIFLWWEFLEYKSSWRDNVLVAWILIMIKNYKFYKNIAACHIDNPDSAKIHVYI